jgi:hypothetical protein
MIGSRPFSLVILFSFYFILCRNLIFSFLLRPSSKVASWTSTAPAKVPSLIQATEQEPATEASSRVERRGSSNEEEVEAGSATGQGEEDRRMKDRQIFQTSW